MGIPEKTPGLVGGCGAIVTRAPGPERFFRLDAESVAWLEQHLARYEGTVIAVTHDRYFLDNVAGWILELDRGEGIPFKGNYSAWLEQKQERLRQEILESPLMARLRARHGDDLPVTYHVDPSILGGLVVRVGDRYLDGGPPVRAVLTGDPAPGFLVKSTKADPDRVVVIGAESEIKVVSEVVTEGIDITNVRENFTQTAAISYVGNYTDLKEAKTVDVEVVLKPDPDYVPPVEVEEPELETTEGAEKKK